MKKALPIPIISFLALAAFALFLHAYAQLTVNRVLTVVPPSKEHSMNPGEITEGVLKFVNDSDNPLTIQVMVRDYLVKDNRGTPEILPPNTLSNKYSASAWIAVYPSDFVIPPHKRQELNYYIQVPPDARPGGHYAAVMYQPTERIGVEGTGAGVETHVGTLFYIHVKGDIKESAQVLRFEAPGFKEYGPVSINTEILNSGDLHAKPVGTITVSNMFGQEVEKQDIETHNIFPERTYLYNNDFGGKWMFGRYTAKLSATYGLANNLTLAASTSFIVFPWKIAVVVALIIVIIILGIIAIRRRKKHAHHQEQSSS
jgi:hypothetical protein